MTLPTNSNYFLTKQNSSNHNVQLIKGPINQKGLCFWQSIPVIWNFEKDSTEFMTATSFTEVKSKIDIIFFTLPIDNFNPFFRFFYDWVRIS